MLLINHLRPLLTSISGASARNAHLKEGRSGGSQISTTSLRAGICSCTSPGNQNIPGTRREVVPAGVSAVHFFDTDGSQPIRRKSPKQKAAQNIAYRYVRQEGPLDACVQYLSHRPRAPNAKQHEVLLLERRTTLLLFAAALCAFCGVCCWYGNRR